MKKIVTILSVICIFLESSLIWLAPHKTARATSTNSTELSHNYGYYKALSSCLFFKTSDITNMEYSNIYFIIPEGYFVKKIQEVTTTTLKVSYNNISGYVMTERVKLVSFLPTVKYLENITFNISSSSGTQLWKYPTSENSSDIVFKYIPAGTTNISYIAEARGEIPAGYTSSVWYYCYFSPESEPTSVYAGYIHKEKTSSLLTIPENTEDDEIIQNETTNNQSDPLELSTTIKTILICLISLPILSIIVVMILSAKRKEKINKQTQISNSLNIDQNNNQTEVNYSNHTQNNYSSFINPTIKRKSSRKIDDLKNKKYTIKDSFDNFMFEEEKPNPKISFSNLDFDEDDDLL